MSLREHGVGTIQKRSARPCAGVDTHLRSAVKFCVAQFCDFVRFFSSSQFKVSLAKL